MAATVSISIVGRPYDIACDEGQEETIRTLAAEVDRRALELLRSVGPVSDARLLVMVALLLADELGEQRRVQQPSGVDDAADGVLAEGIAALAKRIEVIAQRLERA
jgi:cell division protein ZapA